MKKTLLFCAIIICCLLLPYCYISCKKGTSSTGTNNELVTEVKYTRSGEIITNPERGFMHLYTVPSEGEPLKLPAMKALAIEKVSLVHRMYYFEKFRDKPLSTAELDLMRTDFSVLREAGLKMVIGFAYTGIEYTYYNGEPDAPFSTIEMHLDQLKPVLESNKDVIAFVQAGFIGPWGEWHSSTNNLTTPENMRKVLNKMMACVPSELMIQVRTPLIKQTIFNSKASVENNQAYSGEGRARVGHYNDCFLSGPTDYDTYIDIVAEKNYIAADALYVPTGGETCPPQAGTPGCDLTISEMTKLKWTYLNLDWYVPTLNAWRTSGCFTEFQRNLGYRLSLVSGRFPKEAVAGKQIKIQVVLENTGYAPLYNLKKTSLVLKEKTSGQLHQLPLTTDLRSCKPAGKLTIDETIELAAIPAGNYDLFLKIADRSEGLANKPAYCVRLANSQITWTDNGWNSLSYQLKIVTQ